MLKATAISAADGLPLLHAKVLKKTQPPSHHFVYVHMAKSNRAVPCCCQELPQPADITGQAGSEVEMETSLAAKMEPPPLLSHGRGEARSEAKVWETHHQVPSLDAAFGERRLRRVSRQIWGRPGKAGDGGQAKGRARGAAGGFASETGCGNQADNH